MQPTSMMIALGSLRLSRGRSATPQNLSRRQRLLQLLPQHAQLARKPHPTQMSFFPAMSQSPISHTTFNYRFATMPDPRHETPQTAVSADCAERAEEVVVSQSGFEDLLFEHRISSARTHYICAHYFASSVLLGSMCSRRRPTVGSGIPRCT